MPVYDYKCKEHGVFNDLASMQESDKPCACPICSKLSPRIIRIAPTILDMAPEKRRAHETNEKSQHEPVFSNVDKRENDSQHKNGCGCEQNLRKSNLIYTGKGEKMFPSMRPWMISH
ncbi:MAG: putative FmdB family regulatory protein [Flavobacteriales bacterium]|jgi:putative FmdB family regulatory protein